MMLYGKYLLFEGKLFDGEEKIKYIENIKMNSVNELIEQLNFEKFSLALVGKNANKIKL